MRIDDKVLSDVRRILTTDDSVEDSDFTDSNPREKRTIYTPTLLSLPPPNQPRLRGSPSSSFPGHAPAADTAPKI